MLAEQGHELWIGHASEIRAGGAEAKDGRATQHTCYACCWRSGFHGFGYRLQPERDTRQLLRHRYQLVCFRVSVKNQLHGLAMSQGVGRKEVVHAKGREERKLARSVAATGVRAKQGMLDQLNPVIEELTEPCNNNRPRARRTPLIDDLPGRGSGNRTGLCADPRAGGTLPAEQQVSYLGTESAETLQRRKAAYLRDQQAGQQHDALGCWQRRKRRCG